MREIANESIDMIFCDLPYGVTKNKWDSVIPPELLWAQYKRIIKPNGAILLFGQDKFTAKMMLSNEKLHRYNIIWRKVLKSGFLNANRMPLREHEDHSKGKAKGENAEDILNNRVYGAYKVVETTGDMKHPSSIWEFPKSHPSVAISSTEKPIELCRYAIRTFTNPGAVVLDNCCGCGSIPIAAKLEGRHYIGMDNGICDNKKSKYFGMPWADVATQRLAEIA